MRPTLLQSLALLLLAACTGPTTDDADGDGISVARDCDDADASVGEPQPEVCNGVDDDCNGLIDDSAADAPSWFRDLDGDSWGAETGTPLRGCEPPDPTGWVDRDKDCNDSFDTVFPGAEERCDGQDNDCDGTVDEDPVDPFTFFADKDDDGWGDPDDTRLGCTPTDGYIGRLGDCDDLSALINPEAVEICNAIDDDCNGAVDDDVPDAPVWFLDADGDGFAGEGAATVQSCAAPEGFTAEAGDCDDDDDARYPGNTEICDDKDNDCDEATTDEDRVAVDGVAATDLADAVSRASSGSEIAVCDGVWSANLEVDFDVTLQGYGTPENTLLTPAADGPILTVTGGASVTVNEVSFVDGSATRGGAIEASSADFLTVRDCIFEGNLAEDGGAIHAPGSTVEITDSTFTDNVATADGGALYLGVTTLARVTLTGNAAARGGALALDGGDAVFDIDTLFQDNEATTAGGAIAVLGAHQVSDGEVDSNASDGDGGGLWLADGASMVAMDVHDNTAELRGGGVACAGDCRIDSPLLTDNAATDGGGLALVGAGEATVVGASITGNLATEDGGGVLVDDSAGTVSLESSSIVTGNSATVGGGAAVRAGTLESDGSDFGTGSTDNDPDDVDVDGTSYDSYGTGATFTCSVTDGSCS